MFIVLNDPVKYIADNRVSAEILPAAVWSRYSNRSAVCVCVCVCVGV